jgi:hypothetical protein
MQKIFEKILLIIGWFRIFLSPALGGLLLAAIMVYCKPDDTGKIIGAFFLVLGFCLGVITANNISKKHDPFEFLSRVDASSDLNNLRQDANSFSKD